MKTADIHDAFSSEVEVCSLSFLILGRKRSFFGPVATLQCFEDHALLKSELEMPGKGRVLVVDGGGSLQSALFGDKMAGLLFHNDWAGIIIHGAIRDRDEIDCLEVGVRCLGVTPRRSAGAGIGSQEVPVEIGGTTFRPGDYVYCDADGLLISRRALV
ncbi:ribonuclease E activity regulator RraA [Solirhodobacter olei]|uniref:ribonuclease E activity regulator RraA n=1 Tax=Solirhodobacter olei TaxID=2493082 RepID=UPI000FDAE8C1|nr:ribonuclease E activity regulator RraA [Solirhodobacter olei]